MICPKIAWWLCTPFSVLLDLICIFHLSMSVDWLLYYFVWLRDNFIALTSWMCLRIGIEEVIKTSPNTIFGTLISRKSEKFVIFFAEFIEPTYADNSCRILWMTSTLLDHFSLLFRRLIMRCSRFDRGKDLGPDSVPPLILRNYASAFALALRMLFNRVLATCVFPDICWWH
jgi:hypothetical protein